jgi:nucleoside-diphosphate-sugar epimerase
MAVDYLIVHLSMVVALAVSVVYQTGIGNTASAHAVVSGFRQYYTTFFWVLSPIFPLVFLLNGFYTHSRAYVGRYKALVILRGVLVAAMVFFVANFLLFAGQSVPRSVALPFMVLAATGAALVRILKDILEKRYFVKAKSKPLPPPRREWVLVVGGAGYIGSLLAERLLEKGYRVRVLDNLLYGDEALRTVRNHPDFELIVGDARNIQDVVRSVRGVESIIDLAAIVGDPACEQDGRSALETNYAATRMLIEIAKGHGVSRLLFASSCSVYGATDIEVDENATVRPISLYGQTKVDSERALLEARTDTFHPTILRFATVFGLSYRPRFDLVVNLLTAKAKQEGVITIYNGQQWRPFIHVRDLGEAILRVLDTPARLVSGEIFNVGDKRLNYTLSQVAEAIRGLFPNVRVENVENSDRRNYRVNFDKLFIRTGFRARYTLRDGIEELAKAFDEGLITDYSDLRYHNQRYLKVAGSPEHKDGFDAAVMAAHADTFHLLDAELLLGSFHDELAAAATPEECWEALRRAYSQFGFYEIKFKMGDRIYRDTTNGHGIPRSWTVRIQLSEKDYLNLSREFEKQAPPIVGRFSDVIGQVLTAKTSGTQPQSFKVAPARKSAPAPPAFKAQGAA